MLECFFFMKRPDIIAKTEEIKKALFDTDTDSESESEEENNSVEDEEFKESECTCALCGCINKIYERWSDWTPENPMEKILKERIDIFGVSRD